ncbi:unnamed protein product [Mytilus edulis]|uniref:Uncharacterized protein n=1 Tax=Mytilus edulis TaxID=6550 RepID=A0A8S3QXN4_MYTED|nr:unnamed protein product [Mytilus edulis]
MVWNESLLPLMAPTTMCVVGPTQSGKTMYTNKLIENANVMFTESRREYCAYSEDQPVFKEMRGENQDVTYHEGLPDKKTIEEFTHDMKHTLIIIDDLMSKLVQSDDLLQLFTVTSHHRMASCCFISQNLFWAGKHARSISLNCANFVLFRNPRDMRQFSSFASQIQPGKTKYFSDSFRKPSKNPSTIFCAMAKELILISKRQFEEMSKDSTNNADNDPKIEECVQSEASAAAEWGKVDIQS